MKIYAWRYKYDRHRARDTSRLTWQRLPVEPVEVQPEHQEKAAEALPLTFDLYGDLRPVEAQL